MVLKQRIILAHIDGLSNRAIANALHLSKDTVNKYVNEYDEKRAELLLTNPDMDTAEIIQAFIESQRTIQVTVSHPKLPQNYLKRLKNVFS